MLFRSIPVRAAENRAWLVACCKIGPLLPGDRLAEFSANMGVPAELLRGAGESQIVRPDGTVVARGPRDTEAVVVADADLSLTGLTRPDGTDLVASRRPRIYAPLFAPTPPTDDHPRADEVRVAAASDVDSAHEALQAGAALVVLPELLPGDVAEVQQLLADSEAVIATSIRHTGESGVSHCGVLVSRQGLVLHQPQLHYVARHSWVTRLGSELHTVDLPWGRVALVVGDDVLYPEVPRLAALAAADLIVVPWAAGGELWDVELCLPERAAENRVCLVAAGPRCLVIDLPADFTLWAPERTRPFDGTINLPEISDHERLVVGTVHPSRSLNRRISRNTDLVDGRPWQLCESLVH